MPATEQSGTVLDWLQDIEANHYLTTTSSNTSPADDTETFYAVWGGQDDEDFVLTATPDTTDLSVAAGYNAATSQTSGGDFDDDVYSQRNNDAPQSYTDSVEYYYDSGTDWFWTVAKGDFGSNNYIALGWQTVNTYWEYTFSHKSVQEALLAHSDDDINDGFADAASMCRIDNEQSLSRTLLRNRQDTLQPLIGSLTQANTWRTTDRTIVLKGDGGPAVVGEIDAWGLDPAPQSRRPDHRDTFDTGSAVYEYIWPEDATGYSAYGMFFRVE